MFLLFQKVDTRGTCYSRPSSRLKPEDKNQIPAAPGCQREWFKAWGFISFQPVHGISRNECFSLIMIGMSWFPSVFASVVWNCTCNCVLHGQLPCCWTLALFGALWTRERCWTQGWMRGIMCVFSFDSHALCPGKSSSLLPWPVPYEGGLKPWGNARFPFTVISQLRDWWDQRLIKNSYARKAREGHGIWYRRNHVHAWYLYMWKTFTKQVNPIFCYLGNYFLFRVSPGTTSVISEL